MEIFGGYTSQQQKTVHSVTEIQKECILSRAELLFTFLKVGEGRGAQRKVFQYKSFFRKVEISGEKKNFILKNFYSKSTSTSTDVGSFRSFKVAAET